MSMQVWMLSELDNFIDVMYIKTKNSKDLATAKIARLVTFISYVNSLQSS